MRGSFARTGPGFHATPWEASPDACLPLCLAGVGTAPPLVAAAPDHKGAGPVKQDNTLGSLFQLVRGSCSQAPAPDDSGQRGAQAEVLHPRQGFAGAHAFMPLHLIDALGPPISCTVSQINLPADLSHPFQILLVCIWLMESKRLVYCMQSCCEHGQCRWIAWLVCCALQHCTALRCHRFHWQQSSAGEVCFRMCIMPNQL